MSHQLTKEDQMVAAVGNKKSGEKFLAPWHGLGVTVEDVMTSADCISKANLGWSVSKEQVKRQNKQRRTEIVDGQFYIVRDDIDKTLGIVGSYYHPFQNTEAFDFFDSLVKDGEAMYHTAGSLFGGKKIWLLAELPEYVPVAKDPINRYMLLSHRHDGKGMIEAMFTPVRVVCNNTLSFAMSGNQQRIKVRHTKNAGDKLSDAKRAIGLAQIYFEEIGKAYGEMANFSMKEAILEKYFGTVVPDPKKGNATRAENTREELTKIFNESEAIIDTPAEGNLWGAFNAVTEFAQHHKTIPAYGNDVAEQRFEKTVFGSSGADEIRRIAFDTALDLLKN